MFINSYQNFMHWTSNISFICNYKCNFLKRGSVCALYLLFVITRKVRCCSSHSKPLFLIPNLMCARISESYIHFMTENGKYRFSLSTTPNVCEILLAILYVSSNSYIHSLLYNPKKSNSVIHSMKVLFKTVYVKGQCIRLYTNMNQFYNRLICLFYT